MNNELTTPLAVDRDAWETPDGRVRLYRGDCLDVLKSLPDCSVDAVITDPPYSARTHMGHDASAQGHKGFGFDGANRKELGYAAWTDEIVDAAIEQMHRVCGGWIACMCDHVLMPAYHASMSKRDRYTFAPLPWYVPGSRVRLSGDGPSTWVTWIVVSRTKAQAKWGTLPGGYMQRGEQPYMGGKPVELMDALISDYSRRGDVVCDPCMGSGTTGVSAVKLGRQFVGIEINREAFDIAVDRITRAIEDARTLWDDVQEPEQQTLAI